jgi:Co/Zn/Cd efflux system component
MFSDVAGFMISFFSIHIARRKSTVTHSMGYHRAEILGALASVFFIWVLLIWLNWSATNRIIFGVPDIDARLMLITACFGLACNLLNLLALNCFCNPDAEDDEDFEDEEISSVESGKNTKHGKGPAGGEEKLASEKRMGSEKSKTSLAGSLKGVYRPRHARGLGA